jgi:hypothetical protein
MHGRVLTVMCDESMLHDNVCCFALPGRQQRSSTHLRAHLHHLRLNTQVHKVLGHLQANEACAHHHRALHVALGNPRLDSFAGGRAHTGGCEHRCRQGGVLLARKCCQVEVACVALLYFLFFIIVASSAACMAERWLQGGGVGMCAAGSAAHCKSLNNNNKPCCPPVRDCLHGEDARQVSAGHPGLDGRCPGGEHQGIIRVLLLLARQHLARHYLHGERWGRGVISWRHTCMLGSNGSSRARAAGLSAPAGGCRAPRTAGKFRSCLLH